MSGQRRFIGVLLIHPEPAGLLHILVKRVGVASRFPARARGDRPGRLGERRRQEGTTLSGGEQQMLAIGRTLARDVKLLLLDEPYEGLAPVIVQEIERTLEQIKDLGITTVIVEQNAVAALHLADRAIILDMGQVVFDGTAQEVLDDAELRQEYLAI